MGQKPFSCVLVLFKALPFVWTVFMAGAWPRAPHSWAGGRRPLCGRLRRGLRNKDGSEGRRLWKCPRQSGLYIIATDQSSGEQLVF